MPTKPVAVRQQLLAQQHDVQTAVLDGLLRHGGIVELAVAQNGDIAHNGLDLLVGVQIDAFLLIGGGDLEPVLLVAAAIQMQGVEAAVLL